MVKLRKEIKGNIYGKLQATGNYYRKGNRLKEEVKCLKCGYVHYVDRPSLLSNLCGCRMCGHTKHGLANSRFYNIYRCMTQRCRNKNTREYHNYGGRGIKCLWDTYQEFIDDMYESYENHVKEFGEKETTIDRIDVNGNYCKENCRWATNEEQGNNTRKSHGVYKFVRDTGLPLGTVSYRFYTKKLSLDEIKKNLTNKYSLFDYLNKIGMFIYINL